MDWVNGHAKLKTRESTVATAQNFLRDWWRRRVDQRQPTADWATHIYLEHNEEANLLATKGERRGATMNRLTQPMSCCLRSAVSVGFGMAVAMMESAGQVFTKTLRWVPIF